MDNGEFRLEALRRGEDEKEDEGQLEELRNMFLAGINPDCPSQGYPAEIPEDTNRPPIGIAMEKEKAFDKLRRIVWNIFG